MRSTTKPPEGTRETAVAGGAVLSAAALLYAFYPASRPALEEAAPAVMLPAAQPSPPGAAAAAPAPSADGLKLVGLLGGGTIIATADGQQRWIAIGRDVLPGLKVERIEPQHVALASAAGEIRLGFDGVSAPVAAASPAAAPGSLAAAEAAQREETLRYRLGLAPMRGGTGYVVRRGVPMPSLERAGLRPGDVIMGVNGSRLNEEQMLELAWTIANETRVEFDVVRGGRRMRLALDATAR